jgi:hypothetical protein
MPTTTVKFLMSGLAISYYKAKKWKTIFLCDETHELLFSYHKDNQEIISSTSLADVGTIEFKTSGIQSPASPSYNFGQVFDFTTGYSHKKIKEISPTGGIKVVKMTTPNAVLSPYSLTDMPYSVWRVGHPSTARPIGHVAEIVSGDYVFDRGKVSLTIPGMNDIEFEEGHSHTIWLNNHCGAECKQEDDFKLYYSILKSDGEPEIRAGRSLYKITSKSYELGRVNCDPSQVSAAANMS